MLNVTIKPINLLLENIVQNKIGHNQYGLFAALNALSFLFIVLLDIGINQFLTKKFASEEEKSPEHLSVYFSFKLILAIVYPVLMVGIGYLMGYRGMEIPLLLVISLSYSAYQLLMYIRAKYQASQFFALDSFASISDKSLLILFTSILLVTGITIQSYTMARFASMLVALFIVAIPAFFIYSPKAFNFKWNHEAWASILKQTYPFAFITILFSLHDKIDQVMIERMLGEYASGLYAAAYRWLDAFMMFLWIVLPMFFARFAFFKDKPQDLTKVLSMAQVVSGVPMIFVSCFVWFHGQQLFFLLGNSTASEITQMTHCLQILFGAVFIHAMLACLGTLLSATGGEFFINKILVVSIVLNIGLNVVLLPSMGISGAAIATVVSNLVVSLSYLIYIIVKKEIQLNYLLFVKLFVIAIITYGSFYFMGYLELHWWVSTITAGFIVLVSFLILKLHHCLYKF